MRIKEVVIKNDKSLIVYLTEMESKDVDIINRINEFKRLYKNISIFVSGNTPIEKVLKVILDGD